MTILWDSLRGPGMKILVAVFDNSLWEDLVESLAKSFKWSVRDLVQVLVRRSCGDPVDILLKRLRSWRCFALVLVWKFFWDGHTKFLSEDLLKALLDDFWIWHFLSLRCPGPGMKSWCEVLMTRHNVASCAGPSKFLLLPHGLLLFHTDCWLYLAHWLPTPRFLGSLGGVILVNSLVHRFRDQHLSLCQINRY